MKLYKKLIKPMKKIFPYQGGTLLPQVIPDYDAWYPEEELETLKKEIILSDDYAELIFEEKYVLSKEVSLSQWIPVEESLPPANTLVLVYTPNMANKVRTGKYCKFYSEEDDKTLEYWECWCKDGDLLFDTPFLDSKKDNKIENKTTNKQDMPIEWEDTFF